MDNKKLDDKVFEEEKEENVNEYINEVKKKKNVKMFDSRELQAIQQFKGRKVIEEKALRRFMDEMPQIQLPEDTGKNRVENNAILIRPQILPSAKQVQYQNLLNLSEENYLYLRIKNLNNRKKEIEGKQVLEKINQYHHFIDDLHVKKFKEKLNLDGENGASLGEKILKKSSEDSMSKISESNSSSSYNPKRFRRLTIYDKIWNCCCRSPLKPYSLKKRIWAGENGIFKKEFQDNRDYN